MSILQKIESSLSEVEDKLKDSLAAFKAKVSPEDWAWLEGLAKEAHAQAASGSSPRHPELAWVMSVLGEGEHLKFSIKDEAYVEKDGVLVGINRYEELDPRWSLALIEFLEHRDDKVSFGDQPAHLKLAESTKLAVAGDWGTGYWRGDETPSAKVAKQMLGGDAPPDWTIHLGDVYYAGTSDEERNNLIDIWPRGREGQLLLNSNHEMYSGGQPLFEQAMPALAPQQNSTSYWSAANEHWFLIGLDTAYNATDIYLDGDLGSDNAQTKWLASLAQEIGDRKLIVMSHHEPVPFDGSSTTRVFAQLTQYLQKTPDYWYWGHLHNVIVYKGLPGAFTGRCVGHGSIPYGDARGLQGLSTVEWYETQSADDLQYKERVLCGFLELQLDGPTLIERLIAENGELRWTNEVTS